MKTSTLLWLFGGLLVGVLLAIPALESYLYDDAYIHARVAENLSFHGIFAYTEGDHFKISSSTGYVLLLAVLMQVLTAEQAIRSVAGFTIIAVTTTLFMLVASLSRNRALGIATSVCLLPYMLLSAYGGMETPIACVLMVVAAIFYLNGKPLAAVFVIAISTWFRFEMLLLLGIAIWQASCGGGCGRPA